MTDAAQGALPGFTPHGPGPRRWRVTMAAGEPRTVEALAFRIEGGALVLTLPVGLAAAYAPGEWRRIEADMDAPHVA